MKIRMELYGPDGGVFNNKVEFIGVDEKHKIYNLYYEIANYDKNKNEKIDIKQINFECPVTIIDESQNKNLSINNIVSWFNSIGTYDVIVPDSECINKDVANTMLYFIEKYQLYKYFSKKLCNYKGNDTFKLFLEKNHYFYNLDKKDSSSLIFYNDDDVFILETKLYKEINDEI